MQEKTGFTANKKLQRHQNRKRKLEAFFNIALMNDKQRMENIEKQESKEPVTKKRKNSKKRDNAYRKQIVTAMERNKITMEEKEKKPMLEGDDYKKLKLALSQRKKLLKMLPRFWLNDHGLKASLDLPINDRIPLFLGDVQHLVLFSVIGNNLHYQHNRWFHLDRHGRVSHVVVLLLDGVGSDDLLKPLKDKAPENNKTFSSLFPHQVEIISPETYDRTLADDFCLVPLSARLCRSMFLKYGSKEAELKSRIFRAAFPIGVAIDRSGDMKEDKESKEDDSKSKKSSEKNDKNTKSKKHEKKNKGNEEIEKPVCHPADKFPRTELLLSPSQMVEEGYAIPIGELAFRYQHYVYTKDHYAEVTPLSPMFGLDCEMCFTTARRNELTRVSIVDESHKPVYETLVMPYNRITNYLTQYSGITPKMMQGVKTTLEDVQKDIRKLLPPDAILVGQSLNCDLHALELFHPYVIDSSVVLNTRGQRKMKTKLKTMVQLFLGESIQEGHDGHDSIEDSIAALKLIQFKLSKSILFGDSVLGFNMDEAKLHMPRKNKEQKEEVVKEKKEEEEEDYKHMPVDLPQPEALKIMEASSLFKFVGKTKKAAVFGTPSTLEQYSKYLSGHHELAGTKVALRVGSHGFSEESNYKVSKLLMKEGPKFDLALGHLSCDVSTEKERARIINTCIKVCESLEDNTLLVVVAGGCSSNGTDSRSSQRPGCFVHLKVPTFTKL